VVASTSFTASTMNAADYPIVYSSPEFGMYDPKALSIWVNCYLNGKNSEACKAIDAYYANLSTIKGTVDAWSIIGSKTGSMASTIDTFEGLLLTAGLFTTKEDITADRLAMMQWLNPLNVTNSAAIAALSTDFKKSGSMYQMENASMAFGVFPEVYFYAASGGAEIGLTLDQSLALFNMTDNFENTVTLMHPKNMYDLIFAYKIGIPLGYSTQADLTDRFGLNATMTTAFIDGYLGKMCVSDGVFVEYG